VLLIVDSPVTSRLSCSHMSDPKVPGWGLRAFALAFVARADLGAYATRMQRHSRIEGVAGWLTPWGCDTNPSFTFCEVLYGNDT
jgi:hypothetical protein